MCHKLQWPPAQEILAAATLGSRNLPTKPSWHSQADGSAEPVWPFVSEFAGQSVQTSGPLFDFPARGKWNADNGQIGASTRGQRQSSAREGHISEEEWLAG
eukprot:COSAG02_NODE_193_length_29843_cov_30.519903_13_plen_101_part_00